MKTKSPPLRSVSRALQCLLWIADRDGATASEVASAFSVPLPTVHHALTTLQFEGLLAREHGRRYVVGPKVGLLADAFDRHEGVSPRLREPLDRLAEETGETAYLAAWRQGEIRILACADGSEAVRVAGVHTGFYEHAHARATGKLLLALLAADTRQRYLSSHPLDRVTANTITDQVDLENQLFQIREAGVASDIEEFAEGVACVSAPICEDGYVLGAYTISAPVERFTVRRRFLTDAVVRAAESATADEDRFQSRSIRKSVRS